MKVFLAVVALCCAGCCSSGELQAVALRNREIARRFAALVEAGQTTREQEQTMLREDARAWDLFVEAFK